jgi:hypothetical protein
MGESGVLSMNQRPPPSDIIERFGQLADLRFRGGNEWSSACPQCGGGRGGRDPSDRFRVWERPGQSSNFWCRTCRYVGFADDNKEVAPPSPERRQEIDDMRLRLAEQEKKRIAAKIAELETQSYWRGFHDAMNEIHRQLWRDQGIPDSLQDYFQLGYTEDHTYGHEGQLFKSPAMTIPIFAPGWKPINVQYRLMQPADGAGKYRFTAGLPAPLYLTDPDSEPRGPTLLVEGAKKGIVTYLQVGHNLCVVAVASKTPSEDVIARLKDCDPVYVALDPDAYTKSPKQKGTAAQRLGTILEGRARFVRLPEKPDDLFTRYGFTAASFMRYVNQASKVA